MVEEIFDRQGDDSIVFKLHGFEIDGVHVCELWFRTMNTVADAHRDGETSGTPKSTAPKPVKSAMRALDILELVAAHDGITLTEVMSVLSIPRSSAHGLLSTLEQSRWLRRDRTGQFRLGGRAWMLGKSRSAESAWMDELSDVLKEITRETRETAQFSTLDGTECVYQAVSESPQPMSLYSKVGSRLHAHATAAGKAMFGLLDKAEYDEALARLGFERLTDSTITTPEDFTSAVDEARARGYATEAEEYVPNSICVSAAVDLRQSLGFIGAISVTMPRHRQPDGWPAMMLPALQAGIDRLSGITTRP